MKYFLIGIRQDDGSTKNIRVYESKTWADKYSADAGAYAVRAEVDITWTPVPQAVAPTPVE